MIKARYVSDEGSHIVDEYWNEDVPRSLFMVALHIRIFNRYKMSYGSLDAIIGDCGTIEYVRGGWITRDESIKEAALAEGYWIERSALYDDGWTLYLDWTQDFCSPPNKIAIHKPAKWRRHVRDIDAGCGEHEIITCDGIIRSQTIYPKSDGYYSGDGIPELIHKTVR